MICLCKPLTYLYYALKVIISNVTLPNELSRVSGHRLRMLCLLLHDSSMLTIELSEDIIANYCGISVLGMSHCMILVDDNRDIRMVQII